MHGSATNLPGNFLAAGTLFLVFFLDRLAYFFFGDITLAPLLAVISLSGLTFFLKPKEILLWTPGFVLVCFLLLTFWRHSFAPDLPLAAPSTESPLVLQRGLVRSLTVLLAGGLCALLRLQRNRLETAVEETVAVMTALPLGVLISDSSGLISFSNERAAQLLHVKVDELMGSSYFSLLNAPEGNMIEKYSVLSELPGQKTEKIIFQLRKNPAITVRARLFCLQAPSGRLVATVLEDAS